MFSVFNKELLIFTKKDQYNNYVQNVNLAHSMNEDSRML